MVAKTPARMLFWMLPKISEEENELLITAQNELKKLQRQYRIMENDKNSYAAEMKCYLSKQRQIIRTLDKEKKGLTTKLNLLNETESAFSNKANSKEISQLAEKYEKLSSLIKEQKEKLTKLNSKILELEKQKIKGVQYHNLTKLDETTDKSFKHAEIIQNRLHNATLKYNNILSENTKLREEVNKLLQDRTRFNDLYKKFVAKLNSLKKKSLDLIEQATAAGEQREQIELKLKEINEKDQRDKITHAHEIAELQRQLHHLTKLQEFFSVKNKKRIMADLEQKELEKKQQKLKEEQEIVKRNSEILEQIKEFVNETDDDKLAGLFVKNEEENFALFNYINELNNEVEILQGEVKNLSISLDKQKLLDKAQETVLIETTENLNKELQIKSELCIREQKLLNEIQNTAETLFSGIEQLVKTINNSGSSSVLQLLGM